MQKSMLKNSVFNIIYTASNILFPFITSIYVSRILLPVGVGKVASAQNIASYFVTAAALGLPSYGVREFAKVREDTAKKNSLFTELFIINLISTTISLIAYIFVLILNNGFNGEGALYICCGLAIFFNYLNIDWIYQGLEEYGYITGRSVVIKCISLALLVVFVKTREDYVAYGAFLKKCGELTQLLADNKRIAVICCQNYGRLMHLRLYKNVNAEIQEEWNAIVEILKQCNYDEDVYKNVLDAVEEYFRTLVQRKKEDKLFELERFMAQVYEENGRCEAAEVAALCLANLYNSGGHRKITPDEYETIKKYLQKFPESMHIRAAFIIASEAIYSPSAEYKRVPDKIINKAKQWSEQYPKKIEFQEAYFGLLFSRLKYAQAQDMRNEQRRVYREMKTVAERANYSEYNESNQLMESVDILHRVFGY